MFSYLLRRLLGSLLVLLAVSFAAFALLAAAPGDAAAALAGDAASSQQIGQLRQQMGLDLPVAARFQRYAAQALLHGDLGQSLASGRPVAQLLRERFAHTLLLAGAAVLTAVSLGLLAGWAAARRQGGPLDVLLMALSALGMALPGFWLAMLLVMVFSVRLGWLPVVGAGTPAHLVLPALCLGLPSAAAVARMARACLLEAAAAEHVPAAHARGLNNRQVWRRHILRNSLAPILTLVGLQFGHLLGGAFVIETLFAWPGLGRLVVQAVFDRDAPVIVGASILIAALYLGINLLVDLLHPVLDPRARGSAQGARG